MLLVINSDADSLELVARLLEARGWSVTRSTDVATALIDLVDGDFAGMVLDLPSLDDAVEVVTSVRQDPDVGSTPVLVLTSTGGDEGAALRAGADGFLSRPFHADDLLAQIQVVAGQPA